MKGGGEPVGGERAHQGEEERGRRDSLVSAFKYIDVTGGNLFRLPEGNSG